MISNDVTRCMGEKPTGPCENRRRCLRYLERDTYTARSPFAAWLCGPFDNDFIIRNEKTQPLPAQADHR